MPSAAKQHDTKAANVRHFIINLVVTGLDTHNFIAAVVQTVKKPEAEIAKSYYAGKFFAH